VIDEALGDARRGGDVLERDLVVSPRAEQLEAELEQLFTASRERQTPAGTIASFDARSLVGC
jgi:hypothetical protein